MIDVIRMILAVSSRAKVGDLGVFAILLLTPFLALATNVTSISPTANAQQVAVSSNVTVTFDAVIPAATVTSANFRINGAQSGAMQGTLTGGNTNIITFNPTRDFKAGEVVTVTVTTAAGIPIGYTWQFTVATAAVTPAFVTIPPLSTTAKTAHAVYPADLNGDGDVDILSAAPTINLVSWYENVGSPVLNANKITSSAAVNAPVALHAGDLDNDGDTDVVVASYGDNKIVWYENDGAASFTPRTLASGEQVRSVHIADIDSDGDKDVIAACNNFNKILLYENNGAQIFTPRAVVTGLPMPNSVYAVDVDGDHDMDIVSSSYNNSTFSDNKISWFENQQSSGFVTHTISTAVTYPYAVYAADMDRDGDMDVLSVSSASGELYWHENNGSQVFTNRKILTLASGALGESVYAADVDGDGDMDVLAATFTMTEKKVYWYENNGAQVYTPRLVSTGADYVMSIYAADVDSDGDMDVMTASLNDDKVAWYPNNLPPVIAGAVANQATYDIATINPFSTITVSDRDTGQKLAISVQLDLAAKGTFTAASLAASGFVNAGSGKYTITATAPAAQAALRLLAFAPTAGRMPAGNSETVRFTITADDAISPLVTNAITTVIVTAQVNTAPSFTKGADIQVNEDALAQTQVGWATNISAGSSNEASQVLNFQLSNDNTALFISQPAIDASGTLTFESAPNRSGTATVTVVLKDNGGTANGGIDQSGPITFVINVISVNDAPSFTKGSDIEVNEDVSTQNLSGWAKDISSGSANESNQLLNFEVSNNNSTLFTDPPTIDVSGTLTFRPAPNMSGTATVTVVLKDDGGTSNGGVNQSTAATFIITVNPVNDAPLIDPVINTSIVAGNTSSLVLTGLDPGPGENNQKLTVTASSDTPSVIANPSVTLNNDGTATLLLVSTAGTSGIVTITIVVHDDGGTDHGGDNETILTFTVTVEEDVNQPTPSSQHAILPTLFSPNADGANDVLRVRATDVADIRFCVYSADGYELFCTTDIHEATETGWNGRYNGRDMPAGTYTWTMRGHFNDGSALTVGSQGYGQVALLR